MSWMHWFDNSAQVGFYALGLVAIIACLRVVILANPVHAILSMIVTLLALAGIFFIVGAPFAGALQVIVYAGAILVLFVFVIMMLNLGTKSDERESRWLTSDVWAVPTGLTAIIAIVLYGMIATSHGSNSEGVSLGPVMNSGVISAKQVGTSLFSTYLMLVEVAAMLLLAALVAAYHLGKKALDDENISHNSRRPASDMTMGDQKSNGRYVDGLYVDTNVVNRDLDESNAQDKSSAQDKSRHQNDDYQYHPVNAKDFIVADKTIDSIATKNKKGIGSL